jgi:N-acetylglucosaminyl-diphospho-decaprenol L-rhamnosyltransferase
VTLYALMPVFNRLTMTQSMLRGLRAQRLDEELKIVVIDDGSSDGSGAWLAAQVDVVTLQGDGSLWWAGGIDLGLRHVLSEAGPNDWVLFLNNDTEIDPDFVQRLLETARACAPAAVGSVIRDLDPPHRLLSVGAHVDAWRCLIRDHIGLAQNPPEGVGPVIDVDALSGRGVLFPTAALRAAGGMRTYRLPHYLADYELSARVRRAGWRLIVDLRAAVHSHEEYGNSWRGQSLRERLFSVRSPAYLPALAGFWWAASSWPQRLTLPLRVLLFAVFPRFRKKA